MTPAIKFPDTPEGIAKQNAELSEIRERVRAIMEDEGFDTDSDLCLYKSTHDSFNAGTVESGYIAMNQCREIPNFTKYIKKMRCLSVESIIDWSYLLRRQNIQND